MAVLRDRQDGDWRAAVWLGSLRLYLGWTFGLNLLWEILHLPLYTLWKSGTLSEKAFAVVHCTFGDMLIALSALALALVLAGDPKWPCARFWIVGVLAVIFGEIYTLFSERVNVFIRASWAYSDRMPIIAVLGHDIGLSPLLQWIAVPIVSLSMLRKARAKSEKSDRSSETMMQSVIICPHRAMTKTEERSTDSCRLCNICKLALPDKTKIRQSLCNADLAHRFALRPAC